MERLTPELLVAAYSQGFFPMPEPETNEILWYHPDPRAVLPLDGFHCSHSLRRSLKRFSVTFDTAFKEVMQACGDRAETWITDEFVSVYSEMHSRGLAHSVEIWEKGKLVGGTYGVSLGGAFFAESKFHRTTDASKAALYHLVHALNQGNYALLEVQFLTDHLKSLGAIAIAAEDYMSRLASALTRPAAFPLIAFSAQENP